MDPNSPPPSSASAPSLSPGLFQLVFDASREGLLVVFRGTITHINKELRDWTGFTNDDVAGMPAATLLPRIDLVNPGGSLQRLDLRRKQGSTQAVEVTLRKLVTHEGPVTLCTLVKEEVIGSATAALEESGARWQTLAKNSPDLIMITNAALEIEYTNRPTPGLIGKGVTRQSVLDSIPENARASAHELMLRVLATGEPRYLYTQHNTKAFGVVFYETLVVRQVLGEGENGLMLIARDTTRREKQSLELFESRQQLRSVLNGIPIFIGVLSPDGIILDANQAALQTAGMALADAVGTPLAALNAFSYSDKVSDTISSAIERAAVGEVVSFDCIARIIHGRNISVHIEISPLRNLKGEVVKLIVTGVDITGRKQTEHALREASSRYEALVTNSPDFILTADNDYRIQFLNRRLSGGDREEYHGRSVLEFVAPEFHPTITDALKKSHETQQIQVFQAQAVSNEQQPTWYQTRVVPIVQDAAVSGYTLISTDITELKKSQSQIYENEERLRQVLNVTRIGIFDHDHVTEAIYWSPELRDIYGWGDDEEVTLGKYYASIHPDDVLLAKEAVRNAHDPKGDGQFHITHRIVHRSGSIRWLRLTARTKFTSAGDGPLRTIGAVEDVTDRKNAEAALIKSEHTLRKAQQVAKIGSWTLNHEGSLEWSEEVYHIFGLPLGMPMSYETFLATVHPEDKHLLDKAWSAAVAGEAPYDMIHRIVVAGNIKWLREQAEVSLDPAGKFIVAFGTVQDITTQRALQEANLMFDQAQHFAGMGSWRLSIESNEFFWSKSVFELLGYTQDTPVSYENFMRVIHDEDRATVESAFGHSRQDKKPFEVEYRIRQDSGKLRWLAVKGNISNHRNGAATEMYGIVRDVTSEKTHKEELILARRKAEEAASIKDEFLSVMSHEIRTPLNSVIGLSSLLLKKDPREDQLPLLSTLKKSSDNLWSLINDVLDFNKIQTGNVELESLAFNVEELLLQIQSSYHPLALEKGLDLRVSVDRDLPRVLCGDVVRLTQILNNLVNNAIKFTSHGRVMLNVRLEAVSADSCTVVFSVADSGIGMTRAQQQRLFVPFQQADKDITRRYGGTGLGLSIVKGLVKLMNGEISVESKSKKGSTFSIRLNLLLPKEKKTRRVSREKDSSPAQPLLHYCVLYVEDVEANQLVLQEVLHTMGARCMVAGSGKHALQLCRQQHFDVILMDLHMPEMDGYETTRKIQNQRKGLNRKTAVVAFTADAPSEKLRMKTAAVGIRGIVTKPFTEKQIADKIKEICPVPHAGGAAERPALVMDFYEKIFDHDRDRLKKIKKVITSDLARFSQAFLRFDSKGEFSGMRGEIHNILPIAKNLQCHDLRALLEQYQKHDNYNQHVKELRSEFVAAMAAIKQALSNYQP